MSFRLLSSSWAKLFLFAGATASSLLLGAWIYRVFFRSGGSRKGSDDSTLITWPTRSPPTRTPSSTSLTSLTSTRIAPLQFFSLHRRPREYPRRITISLDETVLRKRATGGWELLQDAVPALEDLLLHSHVFPIVTVATDEEEAAVTRLLLGEARLRCLDVVKLLFSSGNEGRKHMVRQLAPDLHIDADLDVITYLKDLLPELLLLSAKPSTSAVPSGQGRVFTLPTLADALLLNNNGNGSRH